jgi:hypothetical protein
VVLPVAWEVPDVGVAPPVLDIHDGLMAPASIEGRRPVKDPQTHAPLTTAPMTARTIFTR